MRVVLSHLIRGELLLLYAFLLLLRSICDLMCVFVIVSVTCYGELLEYQISHFGGGVCFYGALHTVFVAQVPSVEPSLACLTLVRSRVQIVRNQI